MKGFGILFIIFGVCTFLYGLYTAAGHNPIVKMGAVIKKLNLPKNELKHLGHLVQIFSIPLLLSGISGLFYEDENIVPAIVLVVGLVITIILVVRNGKKNDNK